MWSSDCDQQSVEMRQKGSWPGKVLFLSNRLGCLWSLLVRHPPWRRHVHFSSFCDVRNTILHLCCVHPDWGRPAFGACRASVPSNTSRFCLPHPWAVLMECKSRKWLWNRCGVNGMPRPAEDDLNQPLRTTWLWWISDRLPETSTMHNLNCACPSGSM